MVWLPGSEANHNYGRRTLQTGERRRERGSEWGKRGVRGSEWGKRGVRQRKGVELRPISPDAARLVGSCGASPAGHLFLAMLS